MLERLHIRNFRGLSDVTVDELSRINLVTGRNNAGKTTLLEAILLLVGAANARMAFSPHVIRGWKQGMPPRWVAETYWKPLFSELDTKKMPEFSRDGIKDLLATGSSEKRSLKFVYEDPRVGTIESQAHETTDKFDVDQSDSYVPLKVEILQPGGGNVNEDAVALGQLRMRKRGKLILEALRTVEPRLDSIEDNASSGAPMIWVDIGLRELVPLSVMGAGMTHITRIVLAAASVPDGVVLVDEIENGLHHSVLSDVWRVIATVAEQFNVQIFATTHSCECVEAAHEALGAGGFRLHRLEVVDGATRCVTYGHDAMDGAIRHNLEFLTMEQERKPASIEYPVQLLVEGNDPRNFFEKFIAYLDLAGIQVQNFGGVDELTRFLKGFVVAQPSPALSAFQSVQSSLRAAALPVPNRSTEETGTEPAVNVFILPGDGGDGMLETLLCRTIAGTAVDRCIDSFFRCAGESGIPSIVRTRHVPERTWRRRLIRTCL